MRLAIRHAWLQKHPSPAARKGEFHWYPAEGDRELRTSFVERSRGLDAPAVLWQLAPGRVSWARVFAAIAPDDGRRYVGMVLTIAEAEGAAVEELLEALEVPEAAPWSEAVAVEGDVVNEGAAAAAAAAAGLKAVKVDDEEVGRRSGERAEAGTAVGAVEVPVARSGDGPRATAIDRAAGVSATTMDVNRRRARVRRWSARDGAATADGTLEEAAAMGAMEATESFGERGAAEAEIATIARALLAGGDAALAEPERAELPRLVASVERWMPADAKRRTRAGMLRIGPVSPAADRVAGLVAAAWRDPGSRAAQAWTLLCELAAAKERTVDEIAGELGAADQPVSVLTDAERAALGEVRDFAATLHAWGRGRLDTVASAPALASRLADAVALRVLARLVEGRDPRAPIAEARWHALLPAPRRAMLLDAVARRAASLRALVEVSYA